MMAIFPGADTDRAFRSLKEEDPDIIADGIIRSPEFARAAAGLISLLCEGLEQRPSLAPMLPAKMIINLHAYLEVFETEYELVRSIVSSLTECGD
jgi:hypothetical protein